MYPETITPKTKPFAHQTECLERSWDLEFFALLMEMGVGKSKVMIDTIAGLSLTAKINGALILAPKGVYLNWVKNEIPTHMPDQVNYYMAAWSSSMNKEQESLAVNVMSPIEGHLDILVMNIEALVSERAYLMAIKFLEHHEAITIIDESTCIKNPQAARTKKSFLLSRLSKYRRIMTGTPITQSPLDLFAQFQFLKPGSLGFTSFTAFRSFYAQMVTMTFGARSFPKIVGFRNLEKLQQDVSRHAYRKLKTECLDLPDKIYMTRSVVLSHEQRKYYDKMRDEAVLQLEGGMVTTTSALTMIMRLQQITCGHVTMDDGTIIDLPNNRVDALDEILEEVSDKVIIWCNFRRDVEILMQKFRPTPGGEYAVSYYGGTSDADRARALECFKGDPLCKYFIGTPGTGGRGLTLVEATTSIYYSNGYNLEHRLQSEDRNHRIGQKSNVTIVDIVCEDTIDPRIVKILREKKNLADLVLDSWKDLLYDNLPGL